MDGEYSKRPPIEFREPMTAEQIKKRQQFAVNSMVSNWLKNTYRPHRPSGGNGNGK